jgi:hypothetical protein
MGAGRNLDEPVSDFGYTAKEVADRLKRKDKTIYRWRKTGFGPPFVKIGKTYYYPFFEYWEWFKRTSSKLEIISPSSQPPAEAIQGAAE